jgi:exodeoxyribonuclease VII large subunit
MESDAKKFFDPSRIRPRTDAGDVDTRTPPDAPLTVSALIGQVKDALKNALPRKIAVLGEISNCKHHTSGHVYFRLKDARCSIDAAMFKAQASKLKFHLEDGMEVLVEGNVDVYDVRGQMQLYAQKITPRGAGELEIAFRQLKDKLSTDGLFDADRKKPIPPFPRGIGIVTSPTGAAVRDISRTLRRRWGQSKMFLFGALVQGPGAAEQIARAIAALDDAAGELEIDVLIVGRGGGSIEDLWAFNEEPVVRAIANARTPIISAVGHEVDVTLADFAADLRAATPTAAAELAVPDKADLLRRLDTIDTALTRHTTGQVSHARTRVGALARSSALRDPLSLLSTPAQQLDELTSRLRWALRERTRTGRDTLADLTGRLAQLHPRQRNMAMGRELDKLAHRLRWGLGALSKTNGDRLASLETRLASIQPGHKVAMARQQIQSLARQLESLSYRATLRRGFSVTRGEDGKLIRSAKDVRSGDRLETELPDGKLISVVGGRKVTRAPRKKPKTDPNDQAPSLFDGMDN